MSTEPESLSDPFRSQPVPENGQVPLWPWLLPRPKFQHRYGRHIVLFLLTLFTTTWAGHLAYASSLFDIQTLGLGLWYSAPLLVILGAHEFGHYGYCRRHNVDATLPYFIPAPLPLTGTFGAVIRIREAFPSKQALFDIGVAGPIAGFLALLPFLYLGVAMSQVTEIGTGAVFLGEPLLFKLAARLHFGALPEGKDILLHPMGFAAWFGMLATALNLLPFGQLDGGHIAYSLFGRRAAYVSVATLVGAVVLTAVSMSWISMTIMMLAMAFFLGVRHPRIVDEHVPLTAGRRMIAFLALVIFIVCFTPVPIEVLLGGE